MYKATNRTDEFNNFVNSLVNAEQNVFLIPYFERHLIWGLVNNGKYNPSIELADKIISASKDEDLICEMTYEKGLIYKYFVKDMALASKEFNNLVEKYNGHLLSKYALNELNTEQENIYSKSVKNEISDGYSIASYPNPFNPVTTIGYTIPIDEKVLIKVYDILGREMNTLVNEEKKAGTYSVIFDASTFTSGVYFYTIKAGKFIQTKKMILMR